MHETVRKLCDDYENIKDGLKILNVGFGLGLVHYASPVGATGNVLI